MGTVSTMASAQTTRHRNDSGAPADGVIELRGITKRFGKSTVLDGIDLDIRLGQVVTVIGPSGSGKSTLLRIADALERPDEGTIRFPADNRDAAHGRQGLPCTPANPATSIRPSQPHLPAPVSPPLESAPRGGEPLGDKPHDGEAGQNHGESRRARIPLPALSVDLARAHAKDVRQVRSRVGFVFQNHNLFANRTALQNVTEGLIHVQRMRRQEAEDLACRQLERVGMAEFADRYPSTLSGGQQQRVGIARAIALEPMLLVLDEPTSALDPEMVNEVLRIIGQLAHEGMTMLMVTHEMRFARQASDHVAFIEHGSIVEQGTAEAILDHPRQPRTAEFLSSFTPRDVMP